MDMEMYLEKYPWWEVGGPHCPIILQAMFVHAAKSGWKEAERLMCHGRQHGLPWLDPEGDVPAIQLVGYWTSREIRGLFHEVHMLKRLPGPLPCGSEWMEKATRDIPSSLGSHLQRRGGTTKLEEDQQGLLWPFCGPAITPNPVLRPKGRDDLHDKALQESREVH